MKQILTLLVGVSILCVGVFLNLKQENKMANYLPASPQALDFLRQGGGATAPALNYVQGVNKVAKLANPTGRAAVPGVAVAPAVDPAVVAARNAEVARVDSLRQQINLGQQNAMGTGQSSANIYGDQYRLQNQGIVNSWRNATDAYNQNRTNTALNTRRGIAGVTSGVRQGLQGAMTSLPDSALDSGATGALARSWSKQGQQQAAGVYNEAAVQNQETDRGFQRAREDRDQSINNLNMDRASRIDAISNQLLSDLRTIDINASAQGLGGQVNFGLRDNVINNAIARLNQLDQERSGQLGQYNPLGEDQVMQQAVALDQAGAVAFNPFTLPTEEAVAVQGPAISDIPLYTRRRDAELGV